MYIAEDTTCRVCKAVFCCAQCCHKHEVKNHAIAVHQEVAAESSVSSAAKSDLCKTIYLFCPICEKRPLTLQPEIHLEMLQHLESKHLPLRCLKCFKTYKKIDDLKEFSKCIKFTLACSPDDVSMTTNQSCCTDEASKITVTTSKPQTLSPFEREQFHDSHTTTPIQLINMRWKSKGQKITHEEFNSDSVSSIKNISSISNSSIRPSIAGVKGKIIRSTSTPLMVVSKPKDHTFNNTGGGHMSSIYNSGFESENSPAILAPNSQALESLNRYRKVGTGTGRVKMSAVTPLRQIMSKSIQKAFAEHGMPSVGIRGSEHYQRKKMFDTTTSLDCTDSTSPESSYSLALDLRLSPAVRRSRSETEEVLQNEITSDQQHQYVQNKAPKLRHKILLSGQKMTTEKIVITRTEHLSSVASVSASSSAVSSNGSINSVKPYNSTNSAYQSADDGDDDGGSVFSSVEIITAMTTQQLQTLETEKILTHQVIQPHTPITRIPSRSVMHKKAIKFDSPKLDRTDSRDMQNSINADVFFTPSAGTPDHQTSIVTDLAKPNNKTGNLVRQNLSGKFSPLRCRPSLKQCAHSTAFSRIENVTGAFEDLNNDCSAENNADDDDDDDEVFLPNKLENPTNETKKKVDIIEAKSSAQTGGGIWSSFMSSVMRLPSLKNSNSIQSSNNNSIKAKSSKAELSVLGENNSNYFMKRCASIAGSLVRPNKPLVNENELQSLKRKRTFTTDNQSTSVYLAQLNNSEISPSSNDSLDTSSKRFRIQGRRPIDRMRINS